MKNKKEITWFIDYMGWIRILDGKINLDNYSMYINNYEYRDSTSYKELMNREIGIIKDEVKQDKFFSSLGYEKEGNFYFLCDEWENEEVEEYFLDNII